MISDVFHWLQSTTVAKTIANSLPLLGGLSAVHLLGFALLMGSVLVSSLRMTGLLFADRPVSDITGGTNRGVAVGLSLSVVTGLLLFSSRASSAAENSFFQIKMLLLLVAAVFHFGVSRVATRQAGASSRRLRAKGATALLLWIGVALAGCAFIFIE